MMKKYLLILAFFEMQLTFFCSAAPVDSVTAKQVAFRFFNSLSLNELYPLENFHKVEIRGEENNHQAISNLYIFNVDPSGFVIVSADDCVEPILGYSRSGNIVPTIIPDNFRFLCLEYEREIMAVKRAIMVPDTVIQRKWQRLRQDTIVTRNRSVMSVPMLLSTIWGQDFPYNYFCPLDDSATSAYSGHTPSGCVATAMAQIINYWKYPANPTGNISYMADNSNFGYGDYGLLYANLDSVWYDYSSMPNELTSQSSNEEIQNVASLIYHCGVSVSMMYGPTESGASISYMPDALVTHFNYPSTCRYVQRDSYTNHNWQQLLKNELDAHRPVCLAGRGTYGGHAFVCDGYDDYYYFHINWGWGGYFDGYYLLSNLSIGDVDFNSSQAAIIGIEVYNPLPAVTTGEISHIEGSSAQCTARVYMQGHCSVTDRGVCWSTSPSPTLENSFISGGAGTGYYECDLTGLTANIQYYVRAYATNANGTAYGEVKSFITSNHIFVHYDANGGEGTMAPQDFVVGISQNLLTSTFTRVGYTFEGWNTESDGSGLSYLDGQLTTLLSDLTLYAQWRPITYAISLIPNGVDTSIVLLTYIHGDSITLSDTTFFYPNHLFLGWNTLADGSGVWYHSQQTIAPTSNLVLYAQWELQDYDESLSCPAHIMSPNEIGVDGVIFAVLDHEGNRYKVVRIGNQCWLRENMRCTTSPTTGTSLVIHSNDTAAVSISGKKALYYQNLPLSTSNGYGLLYNWNAAVDTFNVQYGETSASADPADAVSAVFPSHRRGICPRGWHIPSLAEWDSLTIFVQGQNEYICDETTDFIAKSLASETGWMPSATDCGVGNLLTDNNTSHFSLTPSGTFSGNFNGLGYLSSVWAVSETGTTNAVTMNLSYNLPNPDQSAKNKGLACSVRCLRDILPTVGSTEAIQITKNSAVVKSSIIYDGNSNIFNRGFCWNTVGNPTLSDNYTASALDSNEWIGHLTGLEPNTQYFVRAYATNEKGTAYGNECVFTSECDTVYGTFEAASCECYFWNGQPYTSSGQYCQEFPSHNGCDSVATMRLTIHPAPTIHSILGENEICRNQIVEYRYDVSNTNYYYTWYKNTEIIAENVPSIMLQEQEDGHVFLSVFIENTQTGCANVSPLTISVGEYAAPNSTTIRRQGNSNILVCNPVSSNEGTVHYKWGYIYRYANTETSFDWDYNYFLFEDGVDTNRYHYWVETYIKYGNHLSCTNRTYYHENASTSIRDEDENIVNAYFQGNAICLHLKLSNTEPVSFELFDMNGRALKTMDFGICGELNDRISVPVAAGIYLLRLYVGQKSYSLKLAKP